MSWQQRLSVQREYTGYNHRNQSNISSGNVAALVHYGRKSLRAIFVSYRRSDSQGEAGRLFDDLVSHFGEQKVFMDVAGIEAGRDFRKAIEESVANCGVLLVLIGPMWVQARMFSLEFAASMILQISCARKFLLPCAETSLSFPFSSATQRCRGRRNSRIV